MIENNNIHNCGKLPAQNGDHGIYIDDATGTIVRGNWIHNNADRGVQIYPNGDNSLITGNIIDSNGEGVIFAGAGGQTSDNNVVEHNIITNSQVRQNVESYWGSGPVGVGNVARNNCIKGAADAVLRHPKRIRDPEPAGRLHRQIQPHRRPTVCEPGGRELPPSAEQSLRVDPTEADRQEEEEGEEDALGQGKGPSLGLRRARFALRLHPLSEPKEGRPEREHEPKLFAHLLRTEEAVLTLFSFPPDPRGGGRPGARKPRRSGASSMPEEGLEPPTRGL